MGLITTVKKISIIYRTIIYLKAIQLFYQIKYRLFSVSSLSEYYPDPIKEIKFNALTFNLKLPGVHYANGLTEFTFLNLKKKFNNTIEWDFQEYGKLWNYNLQYFNFLHQADLEDFAKREWLKEIGKWLKNGRLKPEPYPVSLRIINVIRYLSLSGKERCDAQIIQDTYAQLNYLSHHIEYHLLGNHVLENGFALIMGGSFFENESWTGLGKKILYKELNEQILADGGHFELSPMYHQIILFRLLELTDWYRNGKNADKEFLKFVIKKTGQMLSWLLAVTFKNGDIPHFNDSANGIAYTSNELFKFAEQLKLEEPNVMALKDSGYRKFVSQRFECVVDAGPIGASYQPGHSHSDALSFILYIDGKPVFIETGTSTYQIGETRNIERSTFSHNTVEINSINQSEVWGGFRVGARADVTITRDENDELIASHDGYNRKFNAVHQRAFKFEQAEIMITDTINASSDITAIAYFHFHPGCEILLQNDKNIEIDESYRLSLGSTGSYKLENFNYSIGFNQTVSSKCLAVRFEGYLETRISFL